MAPRVAVAIPVLDGARYLDEVLTAVRGQELDGEVELVVVDSGSTDGSLEIARAHGATVLEIPKAEFSHGGTRNLLMERTSAPHVAFLTQDATPAHPGWLAALLAGFDAAEDVAASLRPAPPAAGREPPDPGRDGAPLRHLGHGSPRPAARPLPRRPRRLPGQPGRAVVPLEREPVPEPRRRGSRSRSAPCPTRRTSSSAAS